MKGNEALTKTAHLMLANGKGFLAMDESIGTCNHRFEPLGIPQTVEMRHKFREWIVKTHGLNQFVSAAILFDETIRSKTSDGIPFADALNKTGIIPGIKVDLGAKPMAGFAEEEITEGLDGLSERMGEYKKLNARFAKWRAVIKIGKDIPSYGCIEANVHVLARYAAICQEFALVPIVEPEVLMEGDHSLERCFEVTEKVLKMLFNQLYAQRVLLEGTILKPNMVIEGTEAHTKSSVAEVAAATVECLLRAVPAAIPGIAFLSGGQDSELASAHLNEMNLRFGNRVPWVLTFSYSRALEYPAIEIWGGKEENIQKAQASLLHRAKCNAAARRGEYSVAMEKES
ncbi:MAG TPA: class I fructose-bisphosphate aldolase [Puia sp.]|nr:class I fructose-bisphosphate aldolase [Puia sp.]